jgi:hypothetical protein
MRNLVSVFGLVIPMLVLDSGALAIRIRFGRSE